MNQTLTILLSMLGAAILFLIVTNIYPSAIFGQENEVIVTIVQGSADAGSGENKYDAGKHVGYGFDPPELTVEKGTIVKWINNDTSIHTVTSGKPSSSTVGTAFDSSYLNAGEPYLHKNLTFLCIEKMEAFIAVVTLF